MPRMRDAGQKKCVLQLLYFQAKIEWNEFRAGKQKQKNTPPQKKTKKNTQKNTNKQTNKQNKTEKVDTTRIKNLKERLNSALCIASIL